MSRIQEVERVIGGPWNTFTMQFFENHKTQCRRMWMTSLSIFIDNGDSDRASRVNIRINCDGRDPNIFGSIEPKAIYNYYHTRLSLVRDFRPEMFMPYLGLDACRYHGLLNQHHSYDLTLLEANLGYIANKLERSRTLMIKDPINCIRCPQRFHGMNECYHVQKLSGEHRCVCDKRIDGHRAFAEHALPHPGWIRWMGPTQGYLSLERICPQSFSTLVSIGLLESHHKCACGTNFDCILMWIHHMCTCFVLQQRIWVECPYCPNFIKAPEQQACQRWYYNYMEKCGRLEVVDWSQLYSFRLMLQPPHLNTRPSRVLNFSDLFEGLVRWKVSQVPVPDVPNVWDFARQQATVLRRFEMRINQLDAYYSSLPFVCPHCARRLHAQEARHVCPGAHGGLHVCTCGSEILNHWDFWLHVLVGCRFYFNLHLMAIYLLRRKDFVRCECTQLMYQHCLDEMAPHFVQCHHFLEKMYDCCPFCPANREPRVYTNAVDELTLRLRRAVALLDCPGRVTMACAANDQPGVPRLMACAPVVLAGCVLDRDNPNWYPQQVGLLRAGRGPTGFFLGGSVYLLDSTVYILLRAWQQRGYSDGQELTRQHSPVVGHARLLHSSAHNVAGSRDADADAEAEDQVVDDDQVAEEHLDEDQPDAAELL